jgi:SOS-response transcriptional repressor LexA
MRRRVLLSGVSFTGKQGQYLAFIDAYTRVQGRAPAEADLQRHFNVTPPSVHQMVLTLEGLGFIRRQPGVARSIEVLLDPDSLPRLRLPKPSKPLPRGTSTRSRIRPGPRRTLRVVAF